MLFTTYSDANKIETSLLAVRYTVEFVEDGYMFRTTRTATKTYAYIGMTREAAEACRLAKIAQYTRKYARIDSARKRIVGTKELPGIIDVYECAADVAARHEHDDSWVCEIHVSETDVMTTENPVANPEDLFDRWTMDRTYDETIRDNIFKITSATLNTSVWPNVTNITFSHLDEFFDEFLIANCTLYYKTSATSLEWTQAAYTVVNPSTIQTTLSPVAGTFWKAKYSPYSSNVKVSTGA